MYVVTMQKRHYCHNPVLGAAIAAYGVCLPKDHFSQLNCACRRRSAQSLPSCVACRRSTNGLPTRSLAEGFLQQIEAATLAQRSLGKRRYSKCRPRFSSPVQRGQECEEEKETTSSQESDYIGALEGRACDYRARFRDSSLEFRPSQG